MAEYTNEQLNSCGIYCITCTANGKRYVGQTMRSFRERWVRHRCSLNGNKHDNIYLQRAWNKYGESNFVFSILEICEVKSMDNAEIFWIYTFTSINLKYGFNIRIGGNGKLSMETRDKISLKLKGRESPTKGMALCHGDKISESKLGIKQNNNKSGYIGVHLNSKSKFIAQCTIDRNRKYLGSFTDAIQAAKAYDAAYFAHYGRTDILNFPEDYIDKAVG